MSRIVLDVAKTQLNANTLIFPGHNFGERNLRFAGTIDSENKAIQETLELIVRQKQEREEKKDEERFSLQLCPVPLTATSELEINLALRIGEEGVRKMLGKQAIGDAFAELRRRKDKFDKDWEKAQKRKT